MAERDPTNPFAPTEQYAAEYARRRDAINAATDTEIKEAMDEILRKQHERPRGIRPAPRKDRLPKFWHDDNGDTIRLLTLYPVEGYVLARYPGAAAFAITVTELRSRFAEGRGKEGG